MDNEQQIVVAADVTDQANDVRQTVPMVNQTSDNLEAVGVTEKVRAFTADAGYFSEENMVAVDKNNHLTMRSSRPVDCPTRRRMITHAACDLDNRGG